VVQRLQTRHTGPGILLKAVTRHNPELGITATNTRMENFGGEDFSGVLSKTRNSEMRFFSMDGYAGSNKWIDTQDQSVEPQFQAFLGSHVH